MTATEWGAGFAGGRRGRLDRSRFDTRLLRVGWEELLTLTLLVIAQAAVVVSIERANWVDEMPSLTATAFAGLATGWLLARSPWPARWLHPIAFAAAAVFIFAMALNSIELADPLGVGGFSQRWSEFWARNEVWFDAMTTGGVSTDPLPFVLLVMFAAWVLPYIAAWSVFRWHNAWLAFVPGGCALLTNISYLPGQPSVEFIFFLFASILLFARLNLLRTIARWRDQEIALPPILSLEVLNLTIWVGAALILLAWVIPIGRDWGPAQDAWRAALTPFTDRADRVGQLFVGIDSKRNSLVHSFDTALPLQGRIRLDDEVLFEVTSPEPDLYLRSGTYDEYTAQGWRLSSTDREPLAGTTIDAAGFGTPETREQLRRPVTVGVQIESTLSDRRLLTVGEPLATDWEAQLLTGAGPDDILALRPDDRVGGGDEYTTVGTVSGADPSLLIEAGVDYPEWVRERYLQLPGDFPEEVGALARTIAGDAPSPYVAAVQIEQYLRTNYAYSLDIADPPPGGDAVAYFLFEQKAGYFDHHASAMAVMLRSLGIPARVATGFVLTPGSYDDETKTYAITEQESWAWPEVYFPGYGWVEFNPTPAQSLIARVALDPDALAGLDGLGAGGEAPSIPDEIFAIIAGQDVPIDPELVTPLGQSEDSGRGFSLPFRELMMLMAAFVVLAFAARFAWELPYRSMSPAAARWGKVQKLSSWAGLGAAPHRTPLETATDLRTALAHPGDLRPLADAFARERYGGRPYEEDPEEQRTLVRAYGRLRNQLLKRTFRRIVTFGRRS